MPSKLDIKITSNVHEGRFGKEFPVNVHITEVHDNEQTNDIDISRNANFTYEEGIELATKLFKFCIEGLASKETDWDHPQGQEVW